MKVLKEIQEFCKDRSFYITDIVTINGRRYPVIEVIGKIISDEIKASK